MPPTRRPRVRRLNGVSRLWLLALAVLVPGTVLAAIGVRSVQQERAAAVQALRERLDATADRARAGLERELARWDAFAADAARLGPTWAEPALGQVDLPRSGTRGGPVLIFQSRDRLITVPTDAVLYDPPSAPAAAPPVLPEALRAAEAIELGDGNYAAAIGAYRALLRAVAREGRPAVLHRLARAHAKAGRTDDALRLFEQLETAGGSSGSLPAALVARVGKCELFASARRDAELTRCSLDLLESLVAGRWRLEKPRCEFYLSAARAWLDSSAPDAATQRNRLRLETSEREKRAVTEETAAAIDIWRSAAVPPGAGRLAGEKDGRVWLAFGRAEGPASLVVVLPSAYLHSAVWPRVFAEADTRDSGVAVLLEAPRGAEAYDNPAPRTEGAPVSTRSLRDTSGVWQVHARAVGQDANGTFAARQRFYVATLIVMLAALLIGMLLTTRMVKREMEVARLKSQFVSAVSHDLRTPLASIRQLAELLDRGVPSTERSREYFKVILRESERLSAFVDRVLDFARMEEGRQEYQFADVDTATWLRGVLRDAQASAEAVGKRIEAVVPDDLPPVSIDAHALATAVQNLVDNAVKYSPESDTVWVSVDAAPGGIVLRVRDQGIGIDAEDQEHVFERFHRGRRAAAETTGAGLGLSLVKQVVDAHGGTVEFESEPGASTTFAVFIPTARSSEIKSNANASRSVTSA
ncbi:MAG: hypothetical protein A3H96_04625 [Acidobacteria bacterium RIFCSPLOWO2_02_FULL_67_36]|nr:MAG: hypothetical protein A3H96_04625 [Acidobacteria bacterium RIFCSPLOWO2_02_FULL_67_36]OFW24241.1 MAG: hypothetical protein A3G21_12300 [Acidobacteria bacterium RIFCSPLOWO2_12_FULL_66_21]